jgi:uncharacterized radical SAM superfamily Fe-S cluster-containing enzyme
MLRKLTERWLRHHGYYKFSELRVGGHCGLCGRYVPNEILPKDHDITICKKCLEQYGETDEYCNIYHER